MVFLQLTKENISIHSQIQKQFICLSFTRLVKIYILFLFEQLAFFILIVMVRKMQYASKLWGRVFFQHMVKSGSVK